MADPGIRILDYHGPVPEPLETNSPWSSRRGLYYLGLAIGAYLATVACEISAGDVDNLAVVFGCSLIGALVFVPLLAAPAMIVFRIFRKFAIDRRPYISSATVSLATVACFPAAHLLGCKITSLATGEESYVCWISPTHFLLPWIALGALLTFALRKTPRLGKEKSHWIVAGIAAAPAAVSALQGAGYLEYSAVGHTYIPVMPEFWPPLFAAALAIAFIAVPLLVALSFELGPDAFDPVQPASTPSNENHITSHQADV